MVVLVSKFGPSGWSVGWNPEFESKFEIDRVVLCSLFFFLPFCVLREGWFVVAAGSYEVALGSRQI